MAATTTGIRPGTATSDRQALLGRLARSLQVPQSSLEVSEVAELSSAVRARLLGAAAGLVRVGLTLSPSYPRQGTNALDFYSPLMVNTGEVSWSGSNKPTTGLALFSSKYWNISKPSVQVEFDLIEPGKKHLVELYLTCIQSSGTYQFRVLPYPTGQYKDISFASTNTITEVIDPAPNFTVPYSVSFMQLNPKTELMAWYFHKIVITVAG